MTKRTSLLLLFSLLLSTGLLQGCSPEPMSIAGMPEVSFLELQVTPTQLSNDLSGRTTAYRSAEIRPQVSGIIQKRLFTEGAMVKEGELLYQIDPALFLAAVSSAKAALMQAEATARSNGLLAQRYATLVKSNAVSKQEYDNARAAAEQATAAVAAAKAQLQTAEINLEYTKVPSPISGIIGKSSVTPGALVSAGQPTPLASVQQTNPMYVDVTQSATELLRLKKGTQGENLVRSPLEGATTRMTLPDGTTYAHEGKLLFSEVTVDSGTGSFIIRAEFPNPEGVLMQNLFVRLNVPSAISENAILIPQRLVNRNPKGDPMVMVLVPKQFDDPAKAPKLPDPSMGVYDVQPRPITIAQSQGNQWVVIDGVKPGERILADGIMKLGQGGSTVLATPYKPNAAPAGAPGAPAK
ncbi:efflux RND transporter periplasmic adaptor subunit [Desulfovibrio cuneatus]|uniref:efflux RND transporter periplasmic adaptor subunit n=1 Tax=Desulfovibrio cuneatus TaxID=159728 RepID=UPI000427BA63|nr:efflux RND transporter periplasmic adaptor subunit [Desulfovibrio cuneatus]